MSGKFDEIEELEELERPNRHQRATGILLFANLLAPSWFFRYSLALLLSELGPEDHHKTRSRTKLRNCTILTVLGGHQELLITDSKFQKDQINMTGFDLRGLPCCKVCRLNYKSDSSWNNAI